jgi:hypothetical protein
VQGYGVNFYSSNERYEGEWAAGQRSGWGRMFYADGSIFEGEWCDDHCNGRGLLLLRMWDIIGSSSLFLKLLHLLSFIT